MASEPHVYIIVSLMRLKIMIFLLPAIRAGELEGICAKKAHRYALIIDRPETKWILALN